MSVTIHASPACDIRIPFASWLHPFDGRKFSRAMRCVMQADIPGTAGCIRPIAGPLAEADLLRVHDRAYLASLCQSRTVARILEAAPLRFVPAGLLHQWILRPMLVAAAGTLAAAESACLSGGTAVCMGGGFHHAHADHGEGFCVFADIPIAIRGLVARGHLSAQDQVLVIDLDAHRGNGFEAICRDWPVQFFDMYNFQVYPGLDDSEPERFPFLIPLRRGEDDPGYLGTLSEELPRFLESNSGARLAFYNAGTDVFAGDRLGQFALSEDGVFRRDRMVLEELRRRHIPTVMVTSGGYSKASHRMIARTVRHLLADQRVLPRSTTSHS